MFICCEYDAFKEIPETQLREFVLDFEKWTHKLGQGDWRVFVEPYVGKGFGSLDYDTYDLKMDRLARVAVLKFKDCRDDGWPFKIDAAHAALRLAFEDFARTAYENVPDDIKYLLDGSCTSLVSRLTDLLAAEG